VIEKGKNRKRGYSGWGMIPENCLVDSNTDTSYKVMAVPTAPNDSETCIVKRKQSYSLFPAG
jgi:hypothetical protein